MIRVVHLAVVLASLVFLNATPAFARVSTVPEPASTTLLGTAVAALAIRAYRRRGR